MRNTVLLDPDLFMAIGLSAEANDGIGRGTWFVDGCPHCPQGHAIWLDGGRDLFFPSNLKADLCRDGLGFMRNDNAMEAAGYNTCDSRRVPFAKWCEIVGVDVAV